MIDVPENFSEQQKQKTSPTSFIDKERKEYRKAPYRRGEPIESPGNTTTAVGMTFDQAMERLILGHTFRRLSWPDTAIIVRFIEEQLVIYCLPDCLWHPLILRLDDVTGADWVEVIS
jgi:hypothetical protein